MKIIAVMLAVVGVLVLLSFWADPVEATTVCQGGSGPAVANTCQGYAHVSTATGGVNSARCFALRTTNSAPTCSTSGLTPVNEAWQMDAGGCLAFYWFDTTSGGVPPAAPNKVTIEVRLDNVATVVRSFQFQAAEPSNGASFTFCATTDGMAGSAARAGTYRIHSNIIKDNGIGGVGNYNIDTSGGGTVISFDRGALQGRLIVSSIARSAYPAGSMFAYGSAGDESITITSAFTTPNVDAAVETMANGIGSAFTFAFGEIGPVVDVDTGSLAQNFVVDDTYPFASSPYAAFTRVFGNAVLTGTVWTTTASTGHGSNIVVLSDVAVYNDQSFNIDSRIRMDSDGAGGFASADETDRSYAGATCSGTLIELFNRGESACSAWSLVNARDEYLSRQMTFGRYDTVSTLCGILVPLTPTGGVYEASGSFGTGGTCLAAHDTIGAARHYEVTNTGKTYASATIFSISTLYFTDAHTQISGVLNQDDEPTPNANEDFVFMIRSDGAGGDNSDIINGWCHIYGVRRDGTDIDTNGNAVSWSLKDPTTTIRSSGLSDTGSDGWTPLTANMLASTPLGTWQQTCTVAFDGNTGTNVQDITVGVEEGNGTIIVEEIKEQGDPLKIFCNYYYLNDSVVCAISESYLDGTARTGNALGTDIYLYDPTGTLVVNGDQPTELQFGAYRYEYKNAAEGIWFVIVRTLNETGVDIGTSNLFTIDKSLIQHRERSFEFNMDVFLLIIAIAFFVIMGELRKDALYWFFTVILSIYLLINRGADSIIPIPIYVGWIFITLYQSVSILMEKRAPRLDGEDD